MQVQIRCKRQKKSIKAWLQNSNLRVSSENLQGSNSSASNSAPTFDESMSLNWAILRLWGGGPAIIFKGTLS